MLMLLVLGGAGAAAAQSPLPGGAPAAGGNQPDLIRIDPPAGGGAIAPNTTLAPDGSIILSWLERITNDDAAGADAADGEGTVAARRPTWWRLRFARFAEECWSDARTVVERDDMFANWADLPRVTHCGDGTLIAHWLQSSGEDVYAYDIVLARSTDGGETWRALGRAHDDDTQTEHGFVSVVHDGDPAEGGVRFFWLDGRATGDRQAADEEQSHDHGHGHGDMQLRTARLTDSIASGEQIDSRVCECCNTDAAMTNRGPIVVYRDRSEDEVRDISIVRRVDGAWTAPRPVHADGWGVSGCPVNGPAVAARDDRVVVAWYTGADLSPRVQAAFSMDAGVSFDEPIILEGEAALGRVDVVMTEGGDAVVLWLANDAYGGVIRAQRVTPDGPVAEPVVVARTNPGRQSGFPKLELIDEESVLVVWTHAARPSRLRAAVVRLADDAAGK